MLGVTVAARLVGHHASPPDDVKPVLGVRKNPPFLGVSRSHDPLCARLTSRDRRVSEGSILAGMLRSPSVRDVLSRRHRALMSRIFRDVREVRKEMVMSISTDPPRDE